MNQHAEVVKIFLLMVSFFFIPIFSSAQTQQAAEEKNTNNVSLQKKNAEAFLEPTHIIPLSFALTSDSTSQFLRQSLLFPSQTFLWETEETKNDIAAPWKLELQRKNEMSVWNTILTSVNVGGTAYILYRHLKKYGLK
jgi:hypothetical protein